MAESTARGFLGAGDLYINLFEAGAFAGYVGPFECSQFAIKPNSELKELVSRGKNTYGQVIESVSLPAPFDLTVGLAEVNKTSIALALFGSSSAITQTAGTMADEAATLSTTHWTPLSKAALDQAITVENAGGTTTYIEGEDYLLNRDLGWIKALPDGALTAGGPVVVSGPYGAIAGTEIRGATKNQVRAKFKLDGKNFVDGAPVIVTVHEAVVSADAVFDFIGDEFNTVELPGRMKTPAGFNEPFTVHLRNPS